MLSFIVDPSHKTISYKFIYLVPGVWGSWKNWTFTESNNSKSLYNRVRNCYKQCNNDSSKCSGNVDRRLCIGLFQQFEVGGKDLFFAIRVIFFVILNRPVASNYQCVSCTWSHLVLIPGISCI